jgi:hypothetical protein
MNGILVQKALLAVVLISSKNDTFRLRTLLLDVITKGGVPLAKVLVS